MPPPTLEQRLRYRFDTFMARGGSSIFLCLVAVFAALLAVHATLRLAVLSVAGGAPAARIGGGVLRNLYVVFLEMTAAGNMNQDLLSPPAYKATAILAGLTGVVMVSMLVGLVTTTLHQKLQALKKGRSKVIEDGHTLILGWNDRVPEILRELVIANESEGDACVVILADEDKEEMDDFLAVHLPDRGTTRVVTRTGSPASRVGLETASLESCKSVILLAGCTDADDRAAKARSDAEVIKAVLGVSTVLPPGDEADRPVVAELFSRRSRQIAEKVSPRVAAVDAQEILAKIMVQTSRAIGLSVVYGEILSFDGCEMYFHHAAWGGRRFGELQYYFPDGVPMGLRRADGGILLNPPDDLVLADADELLILAEDDSTIRLLPAPVAMPRALELPDTVAAARPERELLIGWTEMVPLVVREYADYLPAGSVIDLLLRAPSPGVRRRVEALDDAHPGLAVRLLEADPLDAEALAALDPTGYDNVLLLSQSDARARAETTDSETIVILLLLRQLFDEARARGETPRTNLISEVLDSRNQELITRAGVHDFVISNRLVSMILAQISEEADIRRVYEDLFSEAGSEIYLKPARLYLGDAPAELRFADLMGLARRRGEICLGLKLAAQEADPAENFGVKLIPPKDAVFRLGPGDRLVVLAEDET